MNNVNLIGNIATEIELKALPNTETFCASFSLAINEGWGDKKRTNFINIKVFGKSAEKVAQFQDKGSKIGISGRIQTGSYEAKDGSKRYTFEVIANNVYFLGSKAENGASVVENNKNFKALADSGFMEVIDEGDLPF